MAQIFKLTHYQTETVPCDADVLRQGDSSRDVNPDAGWRAPTGLAPGEPYDYGLSGATAGSGGPSNSNTTQSSSLSGRRSRRKNGIAHRFFSAFRFTTFCFRFGILPAP